MSTDSFEGGCLCAAIRYRISGTPLARSRCHCNSCRRATGAPSAAWLVISGNHFAVNHGEPARYQSSLDVLRTFCGRCGTSLTYQHADDPDVVEITPATLDCPDTFAPTREVFTEEKIVWESLSDGLEHYPWSSTEGPKK